jgi:amino acid permease
MEKHVQEQTLSAVDSQRVVRGVEVQEGTRLHRGLKARHITMIAIGGAIGSSHRRLDRNSAPWSNSAEQELD